MESCLSQDEPEGGFVGGRSIGVQYPHLRGSLKIHIPLRALLPIVVLCSASAADKASQIDDLLARYNGFALFNGAALVADHGQVIFKKGYGLANMEWNIPDAPDTKFRLGSITKQFTATLILQLAEQGKIDLTAPISRYLPDYPKGPGDRITIHELLNHTSGIPGYTELPEFGAKSRETSKPADFIAFFANRELLLNPAQSSATATPDISCSASSSKKSPASLTSACSKNTSLIQPACMTPDTIPRPRC